jgi:hypothetical protein
MEAAGIYRHIEDLREIINDGALRRIVGMKEDEGG